MAINIYSGVMGSGKSYEVVLSVIIPAIKSGRRVVTNIAGISEEKIHAYLERLDSESGNFGSVVHITDERIEQPGFFPTDAKPEAVVQGGDLVVIDEAWRFWSAGNRLPAEHMEFFRMHRHHTHPETKISCDLALVFQSVTDISRALRAVVEIHFRMRKLKSLGLSRAYTVTWYEGGKQTRDAYVGQAKRIYRKEVFPLYQSYAGGAGVEATVDKRQNVFLTKKLAVLVVLVLCMIGFGLRAGYSVFHPDEITVPGRSTATADTVSGTPAEPGGAAVKYSPMNAPQGVIAVRGVRRLVFVRDGRLKFGDYEGCSGRGVSLECR